MNECTVPEDFDPTTLTSPVNQWVVIEIVHLKETLDTALKQYRFNDAANILYSFIWGTFCDWYLELAKPSLQQDVPFSPETRKTAGWILEQILILLHPLMPFITEKIWQSRHASSDNILMLQDWPSYTQEDFRYSEGHNEVSWAINLIKHIRSARSEMNIPAGAMVQTQVVDATKETRQYLSKFLPLISPLARIQSVVSMSTERKGIYVTLEGMIIKLAIDDVLDLTAEELRLKKNYDKLNKEYEMLSSKLSNEAFRSKAPQNVIDKQVLRCGSIQKDKEKIDAALKRLMGTI